MSKRAAASMCADGMIQLGCDAFAADAVDGLLRSPERIRPASRPRAVAGRRFFSRPFWTAAATRAPISALPLMPATSRRTSGASTNIPRRDARPKRSRAVAGRALVGRDDGGSGGGCGTVAGRSELVNCTWPPALAGAGLDGFDDSAARSDPASCRSRRHDPRPEGEPGSRPAAAPGGLGTLGAIRAPLLGDALASRSVSDVRR